MNSMKRNIMTILFCLLVIGGIAAQSLQGKTMYVSVRSAELKDSTGLLANVQGALQYGTQVTVLQEKGRWAEVRTAQQPGLSGWMPSGDLSSRRIVVSGTSASATADELALAGKGFSAEVETEYKRSASMDYSGVDAMESQTVSGQVLYQFLQEGHLSVGN
jgi:SH3-like domain-containing protein